MGHNDFSTITADPHQVSGLITVRVCLDRPPTPLYRVFHHPEHLASCVTPSVVTVTGRGRIVYLLSIGYALRPHLRSRLTLGGLTFPRNPRAFGERVSHAFLATYAGILTSVQSTAPHDTTSPRTERSPTNYAHTYVCMFRSFGAALSPLHYRRRGARPVSCYALFQGWLLLSQPPGCPGSPTSLSHSARALGP